MRSCIDLRSDTVTRPDEEMRQAMAEAVVGDDVFREDPTVRGLEAEGAEALGMEAGLFVPSGTMGNQIALHLHGTPGGEVIAAEASHVFLYEMGAMATISGLMPRPVPAPGGRLTAASVDAAILPVADYRSKASVVVVENTHNMAGGVVLDRVAVDGILAVARSAGLPVHLDGARIFNAAVALKCKASELASGFDSVMFCLSKGLGAPIGSLLVGSSAFVDEARRVRKLLGGGMRQVGVLAAAGLVALRSGPDRLESDHAKARRLAEGLAALEGISIDLERVETNIVIFDAEPERWGDALSLSRRLGEIGVLSVPVGPRSLRFVTHRDLGPHDVEEALERFEALGT